MRQKGACDAGVRVMRSAEAGQSPRVRLGLVDWRRPELAGSFYPAELPEDWRLAYYASQYACVWLDRDAWRGLTPAMAAQWREDTGAGFRFVLEAAPDGAAESGALEHLGSRLAGPLPRDDAHLIWLDSGPDLRALGDRLRLWQAGQGRDGDLYLLARGADFATLEHVETLLGLLGLG